MRETSRSFGRGHPEAAIQAPGIRPALFYSLFTLLVATNALTVVGFLMSPDISRLMNGQNDMVFSAYEDRIAELRIEVDRLHSRQYAQAGDINLQLQELAQQQEVLTEQHQYVRALVEKADELGIATAPVTPAIDEMTTGSIATPYLNSADAVTQTAQQVEQMMVESQTALNAISVAATQSTDEIVDELGAVGIRPNLPVDEDSAMGGPFLPATDDSAQSLGLVDDANAVMSALIRFKAAKAAVDVAPIHAPLSGKMRISSGYGNRKDPFGKGAAFHAGIDFPMPSGTLVLAAGGGVVSFVGEKSGYGNVVEIDHGNGIVTRYGHLSAFIAKQGQAVATGTPIAKVGSTGRSTGPHLHFEVRRDDTAVNPQTFLDAGKALARFVIPT